ncbi:Uncharacterised protein [Clostridium carnis]|uniref:SHOCT domain-containing protein n=1 Tax=Clostridium carnis TaxID=1530 RepID=A0ABY6T1C0_9CLOT|nr:SHOCT domain-containing protein [Clostridium carnis]VDG74712.1 Uncharacterised protein [Clostridium carnis]
MGIFSKKEKCIICNNIGKTKIYDGSICEICFGRAKGFLPLGKSLKELKKADIENAIKLKDENIKLLNEFNTTRQIGKYIEFDENNKKFLIPDGFNGKKINPKVHDYKDLLEYEVLENGSTITKGGLGSAVVGGLLFGGTGAIVGGITGKKTKSVIDSLKIKITINNSNRPVEYINLITTQTKTNSLLYKSSYNLAQEIISMLSVIKESSNRENNVEDIENTGFSLADELRKLKELVDEGIISEEEFQNQKTKLLNK